MWFIYRSNDIINIYIEEDIVRDVQGYFQSHEIQKKKTSSNYVLTARDRESMRRKNEIDRLLMNNQSYISLLYGSIVYQFQERIVRELTAITIFSFSHSTCAQSEMLSWFKTDRILTIQSVCCAALLPFFVYFTRLTRNALP